MKVLVIGNGGREHALAWKLAQSARVTEVLVAPGNSGTATEPKCRNVDTKATDLDGLLALVQREGVALTVVGPEAPLVAGVVDRFRTAGLRIFGPTAKAAQLEGSKAFAKDFLKRHGIPTAAYGTFTRESFDPAWVRAQQAPLVVKADGLAAGKGVVICATTEEAVATTSAMFEGRFGKAGDKVAGLPDHRVGVLLKAGVISQVDPLDHDGDGQMGGSLKGEASTVAQGKRRRQ